jgi:hypothetical protein
LQDRKESIIDLADIAIDIEIDIETLNHIRITRGGEDAELSTWHLKAGGEIGGPLAECALVDPRERSGNQLRDDRRSDGAKRGRRGGSEGDPRRGNARPHKICYKPGLGRRSVRGANENRIVAVVVNELIGQINRSPIEIDILQRGILGPGLDEFKKAPDCCCDGDHDQITAYFTIDGVTRLLSSHRAK